MSTNSNIIVKVNKSDIGSTALFDASKLDVPESIWDFNGIEEKVKIANKYIAIYCHWDGYLDGVGKALKEHFNTYNKALNLVLGGSCSAIGNNGGIIRFATRKGEKWKFLKPEQSDNPNALAEEEEYSYLFDNGKWKWFNDGEWKEY